MVPSDHFGPNHGRYGHAERTHSELDDTEFKRRVFTVTGSIKGYGKQEHNKENVKKGAKDLLFGRRTLRALQLAYEMDDPVVEVDRIKDIPLEACREVESDDF